MMNAKYHFLFWRPVTAIDPTSVTNDGFGPTPGFDDGNPATVEQPGWRPLVATPNHPEYPSAHATISSAIVEVLTRFLGTDAIDVDVQGQPALNETRHFATADDLRAEVGNARVWGGLHYRFSVQAGSALGRAGRRLRPQPRLLRPRLERPARARPEARPEAPARRQAAGTARPCQTVAGARMGDSVRHSARPQRTAPACRRPANHHLTPPHSA